MRSSLVAVAGLLPCFTAGVPDLAPRQATTLTVDLAKKHQSIDGFGFSEAFQRAYNIYNLPEPRRSALVDLFFNTTTGAGFSILRNGIGSSPNASLDWMNTIAPKAPPNPQTAPEYVWDGKDAGQLWVSQQAVKYGVKTFYANAWSAPGFMKSNGVDSRGGVLCGVPGANCTADWRQAYANYLVKLIQLYQQEGVKITHVGFVNEPDMSTSYASMLMNGTQSADFIKILHPTLQKNNLSVEITCCEATGWKVQANMTRDVVAAGAENLVGVFTGHTYTSKINFTQPTSRKVWETECSDLKYKWSTAWRNNGSDGDGLVWANHIHDGLTLGNVSAYLWWVGTQDKETNGNNNEKLVLVDKDTYEVSKRFWAFAQYSRNIRPGAVRVEISGGGKELKMTAFVNTDGSLVVVVINTGANAAALSLAGVKAKSAKAWLTDSGHDMDALEVTVGADGAVGGVSVPGLAMMSVVVSQA